jgi:hypothetical protein
MVSDLQDLHLDSYLTLSTLLIRFADVISFGFR